MGSGDLAPFAISGPPLTKSRPSSLPTHPRGHRRYLVAALGILAALLYRYTNIARRWTEDVDEFGYASAAQGDGTASSLASSSEAGEEGREGALGFENKYKAYIATIDSPAEPDADAMWEGVDELGESNTPPPPVARLLRPISQARPFPEGQEDTLGSVLAELATCTRLSCIIRVNDKIDGRTAFNFPHFFLLGFPHSGQHRLLQFLNRHSEVDDSVPLNGSSWFHACQSEDPALRQGCNAASEADYVQNFLNAKKAADRGLELVTLDASSDYISAGGPLARKLYRYFPWAKVVMILRDPLTRVLAKITKRNPDGSITYLCPEKRQLLGCIQDHLDAGDGKYADAIEGWLTTFPNHQIHVIQYEELLQAPEKVLFDLKYFLGMSVGELTGKFNMHGVPTTTATFRKGQYMRLIRSIESELDATLSLLQSHSVGVHKRSWLARWEAGWQSVLSSCSEQDECVVEHIELIEE